MNQHEQYAAHLKKAWIFYSLAAVVIAVVLVFFVARDVEEQFFYGLMTIAGAYVFRPTERFMAKQIKKYTGVSKPAEEKS